MVKVIMGKRGSGKTKQLIEMVNDAIVKEDGHVVCIEMKQKLRYDINYKARLVEAENYPFRGYDGLLAFEQQLEFFFESVHFHFSFFIRTHRPACAGTRGSS